jgi:DNA-directed RNA polymerase specialized sigma24 family protein
MEHDSMTDAEIDGILWPNGWPELPMMLGNAALAGERGLETHARFIGIVAQRYAPNDEVMADDLAQVARIKLWVMDLSRYAATEVEFLHGVIVQTIRAARRQEWRDAGGLKRETIPDDEEEADAILGSCENAGVTRANEPPASFADCLEVFRRWEQAA